MEDRKAKYQRLKVALQNCIKECQETIEMIDDADGHDAELLSLSILDNIDPDETFYEPEEERLREEEELKAREAAKKREEREESKAREERGKKKRPSSDESPRERQHICKLPRCKTCQPFYVSSVRELNKLSPKTRKLARRHRSRSPKGFWGLTMPSTQEIRSRNQTQDN